MNSAGRIIVALLVVLGAGAAAIVLYDRSRSDRIAEGVSVAGVDIGGRPASEARAAVRQRVGRPAQRDIVVSHGDRSFKLSADDAGVELDAEATVDAALEASRGDGLIDRLWRSMRGQPVDADIEPRVTFSEDAVEEFAARVREEVDEQAEDAALDPAGATLGVTEAETGFRTDAQELRRRLRRALERPRGSRRLEVPGETLEPATTRADLAERHPKYLTVDRDGFRLHYYEDLEKTTSYDISIGRAGHNTPTGRYDISTKAVDPVWYVPDEEWAGEDAGEVIPPGPDNPIKARWLGIEDGIGIHGTDDDSSIGQRASAGCIRMRIPEVKELYEKVPVGTPVYID